LTDEYIGTMVYFAHGVTLKCAYCLHIPVCGLVGVTGQAAWGRKWSARQCSRQSFRAGPRCRWVRSSYSENLWRTWNWQTRTDNI